METDDLLRLLYDFLLQCYPGVADKTVPPDLKPLLVRDWNIAVSNMCSTRSSLDALVGRLASIPHHQWPAVIAQLEPKERFFLLDRFLFAYKTLRFFRMMEIKDRQPGYWPIEHVLTEIMVNHYKRKVIFRCLSFHEPPYYFDFFFGGETLSRV